MTIKARQEDVSLQMLDDEHCKEIGKVAWAVFYLLLVVVGVCMECWCYTQAPNHAISNTEIMGVGWIGALLIMSGFACVIQLVKGK